MQLGFVRGVAPSKWAERWARSVREQTLELVPVGLHEVGAARSAVDVLLERVPPGLLPEGARPPSPDRHAIRLYEEGVALVLPSDHELAEQNEVSLNDLALVALLSHPDHQGSWPSPEPWADPSWVPSDAEATLELVATGLGGALMPLPLARHLAGKRTHAVIPVASSGESLLEGTAVWATWAVERDANDVQRLIGVLRGRTARSSR
jgi:DNA-binding transcriptional LysR family regulator